jgi:hypothetical protein
MFGEALSSGPIGGSFVGVWSLAFGFRPPAGNAVDFQFAPATYTPTAGDSVAFSFALGYRGTIEGVLPFSSLEEGYVPITGEVSAMPFGAYVAAAHGVGGPTLYRLTYSGSAEASQPVSGVGEVLGGVDFSGSLISSYATAAGPVVGKLTIVGTIIGPASAVGSVAVTGIYSAAIIGGPNPSASVTAALAYYGAVAGTVQPTGTATGVLTYSAAGIGRQGSTGLVRSTDPFRGAIVIMHGRKGAGAGAIKFDGASACKHGIKATVSVGVPFSAAASGTTPMNYRGDILAKLGLAGVVYAATTPEAEDICA